MELKFELMKEQVPKCKDFTWDVNEQYRYRNDMQIRMCSKMQVCKNSIHCVMEENVEDTSDKN